MTVSISIDMDSAAVANAMAVAPVALDGEVEKAMVLSTFVAEAEVKALTPRKTGRLFAAWSARVRGTGFETVGVVANRVSYAPFIEEGTGPHDIFAKPGSALMWRGAAHPVTHVRHPGFAGRHMAKLGAAIARPKIIELFRRAAEQAVQIALGK